MCFRLLAAARDAPSGAPDLTALGAACGLDVRAARRGPTHFVEVSWGDCACSLYTKREGRERAVRFVDGLLAQGMAVQLLLLNDDGPALANEPPEPLPAGDFRARGLASLPEGRIVHLVDGSTPSSTS